MQSNIYGTSIIILQLILFSKTYGFSSNDFCSNAIDKYCEIDKYPMQHIYHTADYHNFNKNNNKTIQLQVDVRKERQLKTPQAKKSAETVASLVRPWQTLTDIRNIERTVLGYERSVLKSHSSPTVRQVLTREIRLTRNDISRRDNQRIHNSRRTTEPMNSRDRQSRSSDRQRENIRILERRSLENNNMDQNRNSQRRIQDRVSNRKAIERQTMELPTNTRISRKPNDVSNRILERDINRMSRDMVQMIDRRSRENTVVLERRSMGDINKRSTVVHQMDRTRSSRLDNERFERTVIDNTRISQKHLNQQIPTSDSHQSRSRIQENSRNVPKTERRSEFTRNLNTQTERNQENSNIREERNRIFNSRDNRQSNERVLLNRDIKTTQRHLSKRITEERSLNRRSVDGANNIRLAERYSREKPSSIRQERENTVRVSSRRTNERQSFRQINSDRTTRNTRVEERQSLDRNLVSGRVLTQRYKFQEFNNNQERLIRQLDQNERRYSEEIVRDIRLILDERRVKTNRRLSDNTERVSTQKQTRNMEQRSTYDLGRIGQRNDRYFVGRRYRNNREITERNIVDTRRTTVRNNDRFVSEARISNDHKSRSIPSTQERNQERISSRIEPNRIALSRDIRSNTFPRFNNNLKTNHREVDLLNPVNHQNYELKHHKEREMQQFRSVFPGYLEIEEFNESGINWKLNVVKLILVGLLLGQISRNSVKDIQIFRFFKISAYLPTKLKIQ